MPTLAELFQAISEHEEMKKTAAVKKQAIDNPSGSGGASPAAALEDVLGQNVAETKVRIKAKLQEASGASQAAEGLASDSDDENPAAVQAPIVGDKMPPAGEMGAGHADPAPVPGVGAKLSALLAKAGQKKEAQKPQAEDAEKVAAEKLAAEYYAAGQFMAQGFVHELNRLLSE